MDWTYPNYVIINGEDSRVYGLTALVLPKKIKPSPRYKKFTIPGRSGALHVTDGDYDNIKKPVKFLFNGSDIDAAAEFLRSAESIVFSNDAARKYIVSTFPEVETKQKTAPLYEFEVDFDCFPLAHERDESEIVLSSGQTIVNNTKEPAYPSFYITGTGTVSLTIGSQTVVITSVSTYVQIEGGETLICYDGSGRADNRMSLSPVTSVGFPVIEAGEECVISWTGATSVTMRPNWRFR